MEQMQILYEEFLDCGYTPDLFYQLSVHEVLDLIDSWNRRKERQLQEESQKAISLLDVFGSNLIEKVLFTLGQGRDIEGVHFSLTEYFPDLFQRDKAETKKEDEGQLSGEMLLYKAQRMQHAFRMNQQRRRERS
ncbi:hypothetical protein D5278_13695 [bacterium 1XD21-13]|nr:hypothetical protein [bacterium 1XD21-13]